MRPVDVITLMVLAVMGMAALAIWSAATHAGIECICP